MDASVSSTDGQSQQSSYFMLYHYNAAGAVNRERLLAYLPHSCPTSYYLINEASKEASSAVREIASLDYSMARLGEFTGTLDRAGLNNF